MDIRYKMADAGDIEQLVQSRADTLRVVNRLGEGYDFSDAFMAESRQYFLEGDQATVLVLDGETVIGCATMCYYRLMPTFSHPTGRRAHLMNVWTADAYRRKGIAYRMVSMLIRDAWERGATEISLDATEAGRPLYRKLGFTDSGECMVLNREDE